MDIDRFQNHPQAGVIDWLLRGIGRVICIKQPPVRCRHPARAVLQLVDLRGRRDLRRDRQHAHRACPEGRWRPRQGRALRLQRGARRAVPGGLHQRGFPHRRGPLAADDHLYRFRRGVLDHRHAGHGNPAGPPPRGAADRAVCAGRLAVPLRGAEIHHLDAGPLAKPVSPEDYEAIAAYSLPTWYMGIGNAIGQIFFQDNWLYGYLIVLGIAIHSRIGAGMALLGAAVAAATASVPGVPESADADGLFGYNAALAIALGGFFLALNWASVLYAVFGAVISTWLWASVAIFLSPIGMPVLTSAFVLVTWLMLLGQYGFAALVPVAPADADSPERTLLRLRGAELTGIRSRGGCTGSRAGRCPRPA